MTKFFFAVLVTICFVSLASAQDKKPETQQRKTISAVTEKLQKIDGFLPLYLNPDDGKIFLEIPWLNREFLYQISLTTGVGSNPIGLDRGQLGTTRIVYFERSGNKILLVEPNYDFRALSDNPAERRAVEQSFAKSVIWGFKVEATEGEKVLVDATSFLIRDAHGVTDRLRAAQQGNYSFDEPRSALYLPNTKGFPKNTEVEATITLVSTSDEGRLVTAPSRRFVTVRERHSFVELPDNNYRSRKFDPRAGANAISFYDYATDISEELEKRWIVRHRLEKKDPNAAVSEAVKPIVYYVDSGAPKNIQTALIEGAAWWNQAYEAAGFRNAFLVKVLPPDADPMDVRYNVINWVHRSTRGWAYGMSVVDPRTGEIIKGVVTLDSQRARQDFLIGSGLVPQYAAGGLSNAACDFALLPDVDYLINSAQKADAEVMSMARIRQLSAHEVGHTLGFAHNFAASTYGRGSVMDYPAPMIEIKNGQLDFSNAYATGIGSFDKFAIRYAYTHFPAGSDENGELEKILREGAANGMLFISDSDTRPAGAAHPLSNLWDNGSDPIANLRHEMQVRRIGLNQFGLQNIPKGTPLSELENKLLPLYLHHRYQLQAAVKSLGGVYYSYAVRTENSASPNTILEIVPAERQREALRAVLETIKSEELAISNNILKLIPPLAYGYYSSRTEVFPKRTNPIFDPVGAAEIAADIAVTGLLEPNRAARLISFNARNKNNPHFREVVDALIKATWKAPEPTNGYLAAIERSVQSLTVSRLMDLGANSNAQPQVRATATEALRALQARLKQAGASVSGDTAAHYRATIEDIERFLTRPDSPRKQTTPLPNPPGDPIGAN
ncbi:MAG: zinc-dependent metalloprotease [Acidobacteriota bacterium]|nr:zinc-dependent metalloprotease [Acidobacteriota bacterium]